MCDLACKTKIIINGDNVANIIGTLCEQAEYARSNNIDLSHGEQIIKILNRMEDDACMAQKLMLLSFGYDGPTGKMLQV